MVNSEYVRSETTDEKRERGKVRHETRRVRRF
jgi:hypothetical protein